MTVPSREEVEEEYLKARNIYQTSTGNTLWFQKAGTRDLYKVSSNNGSITYQRTTLDNSNDPVCGLTLLSKMQGAFNNSGINIIVIRQYGTDYNTPKEMK